MDASQLCEISKFRPINIFHLEDEPDWWAIVKDNVLTNVEWCFNYHLCKTLHELKEKLRNYPALPILIIDLKLSEPKDDVQGLAFLLKNIRALRNNRVELFALSGFLGGPTNRFNRFLLKNNELQEDHLYEKGEFEEAEFSKVINATGFDFLEAIYQRWKQAPANTLFAIDARMININLFDAVYQVQTGREYFIDVEITALKKLSNLVNKTLKVYVHSMAVNVSPKIGELEIPVEPYAFKSERFTVSFKTEEAPAIRDLSIAVFYGNNLLRLFEMRVNVHETASVLHDENLDVKPIMTMEYV